MKQLNCNTESRRGKHLNFEDRVKLEALLSLGLSPEEIGRQLGGRSRRTIEREIERGKTQHKRLNPSNSKRVDEPLYLIDEVYSAQVGQQRHDSLAANKGPGLKIGTDHELAADIEQEILDGYSPYAAVEKIKQNGKKYKTEICYKTVYNYLDADLFLNISNKNLPVKKDGKKRSYKHIRQAYNNVNGTSISERPLEIESREEYGHWEMDTVVGKAGTKVALLVLSERKTREEIIFKIASKSQEEVICCLNRLERKYGNRFSEKFKTITCDNGCENLDSKGIEQSIRNKGQRTKVYYAHPYSAWERGTNENINRMIRRFVPKGCDIAAFGNKEILRIQHWINNYPRRILGGISANMAVEKYFAA
jgi:IS30 family transposase